MMLNDVRKRSLSYHLLLPVLFAACLLPFCFLGYGTDGDSFGVIDSGRTVWQYHGLRTSRVPGYWTYEAVVFVLNRIGGSILVNGVTLLLAALLLWRCVTIADRLGARFPRLSVVCLAATPVFAIAACSTMDYLWSLLGLVLLLEALTTDRWVLGTCAGLWAYLIRPGNSIVIAGIITSGVLYELWKTRKVTPRAITLMASGMVMAVLGSLPYFASYIWAHHTFSFVHAWIGDASLWTLKLRVGRFGFKVIQIIGLLAWGVIVPVCVLWYRSGRNSTRTPGEAADRMTWLLWGGLAGAVALFFEYPIEISYFLPAIAFAVLLGASSLLGWQRWATAAVALAILSANFVTFQFVVPNVPNSATSAAFQPGLIQGQFLEELKERFAVRGCATEECFYAIQAKEFPSSGSAAAH